MIISAADIKRTLLKLSKLVIDLEKENQALRGDIAWLWFGLIFMSALAGWGWLLWIKGI